MSDQPTQAPDTAAPTGLTPANENPWYVLMTLYGEQDGEEIDEYIQEKNRRAWNAWVSQSLSNAELRWYLSELNLYTPHQIIVEEELIAWEKLSAEVQRIHQREMTERNEKGGKNYLYRGLPNPDECVDLSSLNMPKTLNVSNYLFLSSLRMRNSKCDALEAYGACFFRPVSLASSRFNRLEFVSSVACKSMSMENTQVADRSSFDSSIFVGSANFGRSKFMGYCDFSRTKFLGEARFFLTSWYDRAQFDFAEFRQLASFQNALFDEHVSFADCHFGHRTPQGPSGVNFTNARFEKPATFRNAKFDDQYPILSNTKLNDRFIFSTEIEHWPVVKKYASSFLSRKSNKTAYSPELVQAKESCSIIRHSLTNQGFHEDAHFFFRREMGFSGRIGPIWHRVPYLIYGALSDYGYSIARPVLWMAFLWIAATMVYARVLWHPADVGWVQSGLTGAAFSFANMFKFFGFQSLYFDGQVNNADPAIQTLTAVQTIFGYVLLFFLGLGLRQRFRLR
ncbi:pentapeptide repeat-containing protein [Aestuariibius sp. HNIBRBA575]|uniref:pentapeptide repeat-containing protein n=1 Tax=Aestuariibius sp. HNIBRBA575 TaxID=3233343 RepID=UPI0034A1DF76